MSKLIFFSMLFFLSIISKAQEKTWTLQDCIAIGLENSLEVKIKQIEIKRTQKSHYSIANNLLPTIGFDANQSYNFGSTIDPSTNGRVTSNIQYDNFFLSARMNLIDFNNMATSQITKLAIERAKVEKAVFENEYKLQIVESYFTALYTQELLNILENQLINATANLDRIQNEENIGSKSKSDLYDMELSVALEEKNILETKQLAQIQKTQLFQLLNIAATAVNDFVLLPYLDENEAAISITNPKIQLATINYELDKKRIRQAKGTNLPVLSAFYNYSTFYYQPLNQPDILVASFNNQFTDNKNQQVGLQLSIPIFNGLRNSKNVNALKLQSEKSKLILDQEIIQVDQQIKNESDKIKMFEVLELKLTEIKELNTKTFTTSQSKFEVGKMEAIIFSTVKNQLLQSEYNVLKNKLQLQFTTIKLNLIQYNHL